MNNILPEIQEILSIDSTKNKKEKWNLIFINEEFIKS
jgi:hypothetical protein